jgi:hypothetical protein
MPWFSIYWDMYGFPILFFGGLVVFLVSYNYAALRIGRSRPAVSRWMFALLHALAFAYVPTAIIALFIPHKLAIFLFPFFYLAGVAVSLRRQNRKSLSKTAPGS